MGDITTLRWFFENGCDVDFQDDNGNTVLMFAARLNHLDVARMCLLDYNAHNDPHPEYGDTCLQIAVGYGNVDIVRFILEVAEISGADHIIVNQKDASGQSPLMLAARCGSTALCELIVAHGGIFGAVDDFGSNCLHFAAGSSEFECLGYLLDLGGEDYIDFANNSGESPLFVAVKAKAYECTKVLLMSGALITSDVLELASRYRDLGFTDLLLNYLESSGSSIEEGYTTGQSNLTDDGNQSKRVSSYETSKNLCSPIAVERSICQPAEGAVFCHDGVLWQIHYTSYGHAYYYNTVRKESTWQDPRCQTPPAIKPLNLRSGNVAEEHRPSKHFPGLRPGTTLISTSTPGQTRAITTTAAKSASDRAKEEARNILLETMRKKTDTSLRANKWTQPRKESSDKNQSQVRASTAVSQTSGSKHVTTTASSVSAPMELRSPLVEKGNLFSNSMRDRTSEQLSRTKSRTQSVDADTSLGKENSELLSGKSLSAKKVGGSTIVSQLLSQTCVDSEDALTSEKRDGFKSYPSWSKSDDTSRSDSEITTALLSVKSSCSKPSSLPTDNKMTALLNELKSSRFKSGKALTDDKSALLSELKSSQSKSGNVQTDDRAALLSELKSSRPKPGNAPTDDKAALLSELKSSRSKSGNGQTDDRAALLSELKASRPKPGITPTDASTNCKNALLNEIKRSRRPSDDASMCRAIGSRSPSRGNKIPISGCEGAMSTKEDCTNVPKKYLTMQKVGVPYECILNSMKMDGVDEKDIVRFKLVFGHGTEDVAMSRPVTAPASVSRRASKALLRMHWEEVDAEKVTKSLWVSQDDLVNDQDIRSLERHFGASPEAKKSSLAKPASNKLGKAPITTHIDPKRARNVAISLAQFKKFPDFDSLCAAVDSFDSTNITAEHLGVIESLLPRQDEVKKLEHLIHRGNSGLVPAEAFFLAVMRFPNFAGKLGAFKFRITFDQQLDSLASSLNLLNKACIEVIKCDKLAHILLRLRALGNVLNESHGKAPATGITLESLITASKKKGKGDATILDLLVSNVNDSVILEFWDDLPSVKLALKLDVGDLKAAFKSLEDDSKSFMTFVSGHELSSNTEDFLGRVALGIARANELLTKTQTSVKELCQFFAEDPETRKVSSIFSILNEFSILVEKSKNAKIA